MNKQLHNKDETKPYGIGVSSFNRLTFSIKDLYII